jgi:hypothetical protein
MWEPFREKAARKLFDQKMGYISIIIRIPTGHQSQTHDCLFLQCLRDITSFRTPFSSFWIALSFPFRFPFPLLSWFFSFSLYFISFGERQVGDGGLLCLWGIFFICFLISIFICGSERCTGTSTPCPPVFNTGTFFFLSLFATVLVFFIGFFIGEKEWRRGFNCLFYLVFFFFRYGILWELSFLSFNFQSFPLFF